MSEERIGVYVNDKYGGIGLNVDGFFEFRRFIRSYWPILSKYTLLVSERTSEVLAEIKRDLNHSQGYEPQWRMEVFQNSRFLENGLVGTKKEDVARMLLFLDPCKFEREMEDLLVLRDAVAEHGQKLHINLGAQLWAEREWRTIIGRGTKFVIGSDDAIVLLRQNSSRAIDRFALKNFDKVMRFPRIILTSPTRTSMADFFRAAEISASLARDTFARMQDIESLLEEGHLSVDENDEDEVVDELHLVACAGRGARVYLTEKTQEGLQGIANLLAENYSYSRNRQLRDRLCHLVACPGHNPERIEAKAVEHLIRICADPHTRINLVLNQETANEWMQPPLG